MLMKIPVKLLRVWDFFFFFFFFFSLLSFIFIFLFCFQTSFVLVTVFCFAQLKKFVLSFVFHLTWDWKIPFQWSNPVSHFMFNIQVPPRKGCTLLQVGSIYHTKKQECEFLPHPNSIQSYSISKSYEFCSTDTDSHAKNWNWLLIGQLCLPSATYSLVICSKYS